MKNRVGALLFVCGALLAAETPIGFFGGNNFTIDVETTFAADLNDGSTGLATSAGIGLWFEFTPYADRNITPRRDALSVGVKLANSAFYAWRGYPASGEDLLSGGPGYKADLFGRPDQAVSVWFDSFAADLQYNQYWIRVAGIDPEITLSQASIKSVFDPVMTNRTASDKNSLPLPLFNTGSIHYGGTGGVLSVIGRDLVHLNRREVVIAGNLSAGMKNDIVDVAVKAGSWKTGKDNNGNAWAAGFDLTVRPDLAQTIKVSLLGAANYAVITAEADGSAVTADPQADYAALTEKPAGLGLGYEYRLDLPRRMVLKPYAGIDVIWETASNEYDYEIGGGLQWFFRGTSARFKRNTSIGGVKLGDVENPAGLIAGLNVDKAGIVNAVLSVNESPQSSLIPGLGGFLQAEFMNVAGKAYTGPDGADHRDFLWACIAQAEYLVSGKVMPYVFARYVPASNYADTPVYARDFVTLTSKLGVKVTPVPHFSIDLWYERTDLQENNTWTTDKGLISTAFGISL
ncbi:MAG: hypothetical protein LBS97_05510 [Treponema sp.]|jgi:hypothetical protein|nr:hypothetical protein [Treponema sp.]